MNKIYSLYVGNIGHIDDYVELGKAMQDYYEYKKMSESGYGRCAYEPVTLFNETDNYIVREYLPTSNEME